MYLAIWIERNRKTESKHHTMVFMCKPKDNCLVSWFSLCLVLRMGLSWVSHWVAYSMLVGWANFSCYPKAELCMWLTCNKCTILLVRSLVSLLWFHHFFPMVRRNEEGKGSATVHFHWYCDSEKERLGSRLEIKYCGSAKRKREQFRSSSGCRGNLKVSSDGGSHAVKAT